jgi:hypothetical protein
MQEIERKIRGLRFDELKAHLRLKELERTGLTLVIDDPGSSATERAEAIAHRKEVERQFEEIKQKFEREFPN